MEMMMGWHNVYTIVIGGGPASGKSTGLTAIKERLEDLNIKVFCVPEAASILALGGMEFKNDIYNDALSNQCAIFDTQIALEGSFENLALQYTKQNPDKKVVILCDRGVMDGKGFVDESVWQSLLDYRDTNNWRLLNRYNAVIHLISVAVSDKELYNEVKANNPARWETAEQAAATDFKLRKAYEGHPHLRVIDNAGGFNNKIKRAVNSILQVVGLPEPIERERKFLVGHIDWTRRDYWATPSHIEQLYMPDGSRIRKRTQNEYSTFYLTTKGPIQNGARVEYERRIDASTYYTMKPQAVSRIEKNRYCFLSEENIYFELDVFLGKNKNLIFLEVELEEENQEIRIPEWIYVEREVTNEPDMSNHAIAEFLK